MKKILFILLAIIFISVSCNEIKPNQACIDYQIEIQNLETEIEKQFQENGKLKEQLENANEYIQLLGRENDSLKVEKYKK